MCELSTNAARGRSSGTTSSRCSSALPPQLADSGNGSRVRGGCAFAACACLARGLTAQMDPEPSHAVSSEPSRAGPPECHPHLHIRRSKVPAGPPDTVRWCCPESRNKGWGSGAHAAHPGLDHVGSRWPRNTSPVHAGHATRLSMTLVRRRVWRFTPDFGCNKKQHYLLSISDFSSSVIASASASS